MNRYVKSSEARLEMLERKILGLTIITGVMIITLLVGATREPSVIRASLIQLVDTNSNVRAELSLRDDAVGLYIKDEDGNDRLLVSHDSEGTGLYVNDDRGTTRIGIAQFSHGGGGVALHGPESKGAAVLYLKEEGSLRFFDDEGNITNQLVASGPDK